jgi:hypothetical protein
MTGEKADGAGHDEGEPAPVKNIDRLLSKLAEGSVAHRLTTARKAATNDAGAVHSLEKVIEDRKGELRRKYDTGPDHKI